MEESFKDREHQFEAKFAHDEELRFKIIAHRNKLFAAWAAGQIGAAAPAGYADTLLQFAFGRSASDLIHQALHDLQSHGVAITDGKLHKAFDLLNLRSETEVMAAS